MAERPIIVFPSPTTVTRQTLSGGQDTKLRLPTAQRQGVRMGPAIDRLAETFETRSARLRAVVAGAAPEEVLVIEIAGSVDDFVRAVQRVPELEWLDEWEDEEIPTDTDFYEVRKMPDGSENIIQDSHISGRLFLVMTSQRALQQVQSLWRQYLDNPTGKMQGGLTRWRDVFSKIVNIRYWDVSDRISDTGVMSNLEERLDSGEAHIRFEAQLWYRDSIGVQNSTRETFASLLHSDGGQIIREAIIPEIAYHGILAEVPSSTARALLENLELVASVQYSGVMYFRPLGQMVCRTEVTSDYAFVDTTCPDGALGEPIAALFDGMPLENHNILNDRLRVDDPDNWALSYPVASRYHGTAMASLIIRSDLNAPDRAVARPIYVRPILLPTTDFVGQVYERLPDNELPVDLIHRSVRRLFEGDELEAAAAPSVKIINLSIGDPDAAFSREMSPLARLLDWLSVKYHCLFVVSAGNQLQDIKLNVNGASIDGVNPQELEKAALTALANDLHNRRIFSPSESVNALTVGALHADACGDIAGPPHVRDLLCSEGLPSPISGFGLGYRRSVKPDVLAEGGRQLYYRPPYATGEPLSVKISRTSTAPGLRVAAPGVSPGDLSNSVYARGTSTAAALTTRAAIRIYEELELLYSQEGRTLDPNLVAVMIKTLLVHGASWGSAFNSLAEVLRKPNDSRFREYAARFLGYGRINTDRVIACTPQRVTVVGASSFNTDTGHEYTFPLPPGLIGQRLWRRLTLTLAWITPINTRNVRYRRAALSFSPPLSELRLHRTEVHPHTVTRGTVQHEICEGESASAYVDGDVLRIIVNCREYAGHLRNCEVPYSIAATLEVAESAAVEIYEEVRARIRQRIPIQPQVEP